MVLGFFLVFCPLLGLEALLYPGLAAIWGAKAALNVWRVAGAAYLIHRRYLPQFGGGDDGAPCPQTVEA